MTTQLSLWQEELADVKRLIDSKQKLLRQFPEDNFLRTSLTQFQKRKTWLQAQIRSARQPYEVH